MPMPPTPHPQTSTAWLNGVRGLAALIVAFVHFIAGEVDPPFSAFSAEPPHENRRIYQLPPFRIIFADQAMVALFFVVSAYSISIGPLKARESTPRGNFLDSLSSSVFRRPIRLYMPVAVLEFLSHIAYYLNLYRWSSLPDEKLETLGDHIKHYFSYMLHLANPFFPFQIALNIQVWTIPAEFMGSCFVYLTILATANLRPAARLAVIVLIAVIAIWHLSWLLSTFMCGLAIAEYQLLQHTFISDSTRISRSRTQGLPLNSALNTILFVLGFYLLCIPEHPADDPWGSEYRIFSTIGPSLPSDQLPKAQMWRSIGGVMCMFATSRSPTLQMLFNTRVAQYLGKISFGLYLVHILIFSLLRNELVQLFWWVIGEDSVFGWIGAGAVLGPLVVWCGDLFWKVVDVRAVRLARWVDGRLRAQN
ncbi:unnamed protein product [Periconia digitata]|uniref:Acyltransferase 3 domain-containing protein n=1 Tax=Periconia digitata TaxID=1303443 RepID=A0A9W4XJF9_9PLEO|nr:unnamed protein product [Periconia digitata]